MLAGIYHKFIGGKLFYKMALAYSLIFTLSIVILGDMFFRQITGIITQKELVYNKQLIAEIDRLVQKKSAEFDSIYNDIIMKYFSEDKYLREFLDNDRPEWDIDIYRQVRLYLQTIVNSNEDVMDLILFKDPERYIAANKTVSRNVSASYNFASQEWFKAAFGAENRLKVTFSGNPEYISGGKGFVLTYAKKMSFPGLGDRKRDISYLVLINIQMEDMKTAYENYNGVRGDIFVLGRDGSVIFNSGGTDMGEPYPYFKELTVGKTEVELPEDHIAYIQDKPANQFIITSVLDRKELLQEINQIACRLVVVLAVVLAGLLVFTVFFARLFSSRVSRITKSMQQVQNGSLDVRVSTRSKDELGEISRSFNEMCDRLNEYIKRVYIAEIKQKEAKLAELRTQINPHFLYNTLEVIRMKALVAGNEDLAQMIFCLSSLFKWIIKNDDTVVSIKKELYFLQSYLDLLKLRLGNRFDYFVDIDEKIMNHAIIKFILQPVIENAVIHGLEKKADRGLLKITGELEENSLRFLIRDNGAADAEKLKQINEKIVSGSSGEIGLKNVQERIHLTYGSEYGIRLYKEDRETVVEIKIPAVVYGE